MPISLKSTVGGSYFKLDSFSTNQQVASGVTGDIITITPPAGKRVKLTGLSIISSSGANEANISVLKGSSTLISGTLDNNTNAVGTFAILSTKQVSSTAGTTGYLPEVIGEINQVIKVNKSGGNTANIIVYSYAYGE